MQRSGRTGGHGGDNGSRNGGGFFDPFPGFGGFGFGSSMMQDFFGGRNPFDDPFFTRPFGSFFGNDGFPFGPRQDRGFLEQRSFNPQQESRRGPIIEEIGEDHPDSGSRLRSGQEPIVEHPDDEVRADSSHGNRNSRSIRRHQGPTINQQEDSGFRSYSFQSSSISYGGPNGTYYSSSASRSSGPNGFVSEEHHEKDSSKNTETHRLSRGINEKGHSVTRKRNAEGREENLQMLHNLEEDELRDFDKRWESEADRHLPSWSRNRRFLGGDNGGGTRQRAALPSGGSSSWSGARHA